MSFGEINLKNIPFGEVVEAIGDVFYSFHADGIVGLAFPAMSLTQGTTIIDIMVEREVLPYPLFSVFLGRNPDSSFLLFGDIDANYYSGEIEYFPVVSDFYWEIEADGII